jgi:hypothetical protein
MLIIRRVMSYLQRVIIIDYDVLVVRPEESPLRPSVLCAFDPVIGAQGVPLTSQRRDTRKSRQSYVRGPHRAAPLWK